MLFSVIIPAYNASDTIVRCLDSVYALPTRESDFEIILVDDCSNDDTLILARQYAYSHPNLVVLAQAENHRQGAARNRGLSIAQGKYIIFLDSDDELDAGIVSALLLAEENKLEMIAIRGVRVDSEERIINTYSLPFPRDYVFSGIDLQTDHPFWCSGPVLYIYLRSFLSEVDYPFAEDVIYEDCDFVHIHLYHAKRMGYCDSCGYRIFMNPTSTTHMVSYKHMSDYALLGTRMLMFYQSIGEKDTKYAKSILEGGSYNIMKSCRNLFKLTSGKEVRSFYERFDVYVDRSSLLHYREPAYCWNRWTRFCLKNKSLTIILLSIILFGGRPRLLKSFFKGYFN